MSGLPPPLHRLARDAVLRRPLPAREHRARRAPVCAVSAELRRRGRAPGRARRGGRPVERRRLGPGVRAAPRGCRTRLSAVCRRVLECGRDRREERRDVGLRVPRDRRVRPGRRHRRQRRAGDRRRGDLLPSRDRGHGRRPGRGDHGLRGGLPPALAAVLLAARHATGKQSQQRIARDHHHLQGRVRGMRGFKTLAGARVLCRAHASLRNLRGGHYDLGWRLGPANWPLVSTTMRAWEALATELLAR